MRHASRQEDGVTGADAELHLAALDDVLALQDVKELVFPRVNVRGRIEQGWDLLKDRHGTASSRSGCPEHDGALTEGEPLGERFIRPTRLRHGRDCTRPSACGSEGDPTAALAGVSRCVASVSATEARVPALDDPEKHGERGGARPLTSAVQSSMPAVAELSRIVQGRSAGVGGRRARSRVKAGVV